MIIKKHVCRILLSVTLVTLFGSAVSHASPRARFTGETVLNDPSVRLSTLRDHTCQVNEDGTVRCWGANDHAQLGNGNVGGLSSVPELVVGLSNVVAVAAGGSHTCALLVDGTVKCWGANFDGQIGDGVTSTERPAPVTVPGLSNVVAIAAGDAHNCALLSTGRVQCWGANYDGQIGDDTTTDRHHPVDIGLSSAVAITAGLNHTCALLANGTARCWGFNDYGRLGDGTESERHSPVTVSGLSNAVALEAGVQHTCALLADGTAHCWGLGSNGQLGNGTGSPQHTPRLVSNLSNAVAISAGGLHSCALLADGTVKCWGSSADGQVGDGETNVGRFRPVTVSSLVNAVAITAGFDHTCAVQANGTAFCWGSGEFGQLGNDNFSRSSIPTVVKGGGGSFTARDIAAGRDHTCTVRANGTVACWGSNGSGQIGDGTIGGNRLSPVTIPGLPNAVAITAGEVHTCALLADGTVRCWGLNTEGQLGNSMLLAGIPTPVVVSGLSNVVAIGGGARHTCALLADGTVKCWGDFGYMLGNGTLFSEVQFTPVIVRTQGPFGLEDNLRNAVSIAVGELHSCALLADGTAKCWGFNNKGQLGGDPFTVGLTASFVKNLTGAVAITAGNAHTCALLSNSGARCWGDNFLGQIGNNTTTNQPLPTAVSNFANGVAIAGGFGHTCAVFAPGVASCWGSNNAGQLGNNTTTPSLIPTQVKVKAGNLAALLSPLTGTVNITTGRRHSCALRVNGGVSCWGDNTFGQIGVNSTSTSFMTAVPVPSFTLNIDPTVTFEHNSRVPTVTVIATCEVGQRLFFDVNLTQGTVAGRGHGSGECTGALERYTMTVPAQGRDPLFVGPAQVSAKAVIVEKGTVVDIQEWTRAVTVRNVQ